MTHLTLVLLNALGATLIGTIVIVGLSWLLMREEVDRAMARTLEWFYERVVHLAKRGGRWEDRLWRLADVVDYRNRPTLAHAMGEWSYAELEALLLKHGDIPCYVCGWLCGCNTPETQPVLTLIQGGAADRSQAPGYDVTMDPCSPEFNPASWTL